MTEDYKGSDRYPSWSPDGSQIAFWSARDGGTYYVMPALGGSPQKVVTTNSPWLGECPPQWSNDGRELACAVNDSTGYYVEIVSLQRGDSRRISLPGKGNRGWELSWSPDGRYFAYVQAALRDWPNSQLWVLRVENGEGFLVTDGTTWDWGPFWSEDNRFLYYVSNRGGSTDLWRQRIRDDGTPKASPQRLTTGQELQYAKLSPDGTRLACAKGRMVGNIWRVPILKDRLATWADAQQLTFEQVRLDNVDLSRDGKRLVFRMDRAGKPNLWVMPASGGEMVRVTTDPVSDAWPEWSPDGREIAFHAQWAEDGNRDIWVQTLDGGPARQVTRHMGDESEPTWSPDGRQIAFSSGRSGNSDIWVIPAEGGEARQITTDPAYDAFPSWSPDGKKIAYMSYRGGNVNIWASPAEGGEARQLTFHPAEDWNPDWSTDGKMVLYLSGRDYSLNFWQVPVEGGPERQLTDFVGKHSQGISRPTTDGKYIYFTWREDIGDIWVMDVEWE